jgi:plastocyanin
MLKIRGSALGAVLLALGLAACGGSSSSSSTGASTSSSAPAATSSSSSAAAAPSGGSSGGLTEAADPSGGLKFTKDSLTAKAGKVSIQFTNKAPETHNMTIATSGGKVVGATPTFDGGTKSVSVNLKPGKYVFYCSVPGHRQGGMQGTLTVS